MRVLFLMDEPHQEPLGLGYLATPLKNAGHTVAAHYIRTPGDERQAVRHFAPDVVAFSLMTGWENYYVEMAQALKKEHPRLYTVFGGPHPTYAPQMIERDGVDAVCTGEADLLLAQFVDRLEKGEDHTTTPNFWVKHNGEITRNEKSHLVDDLDLIPNPDRELFYTIHAQARSKLKTFMATRGCPYKCSYCFNDAFNDMYKGNGRVIRGRSVSHVIGEINEVRRRWPLGYVKFADDIFIMRRDFLEEFAERYPREVGLPYFGNVKALMINERTVHLLKKSGCYSVCMGIEAGNDRVRQQMLKKKVRKDQIVEAARLIKGAGIKLVTTNIIGTPGGSIEDDFETVQLNADCKVDYAWVSLLNPYPMTPIRDELASMGFEMPEPQQYEPSYFRDTPVPLPDKHQYQNLHKLFSLLASHPRLIPLSRRMIGTRSKSVQFFYVMLFGFWKLYCYEVKIFRDHSLTGMFSKDFLGRFVNYIFLGWRMMFTKKKYVV